MVDDGLERIVAGMVAAVGEDEAQGGFRMPRLQRATLNDEVYGQLKRAIMAGAIEPGSAMTIRGLAASFGISLMPVREALNRLVAEHVLVLLPNRSVALPRIDRGRFHEITRIRVALEGLAAAEAAARIGPEEIAAMERLNARMEECAVPAEALALNREFHFALYRASAMPTLVAMIETAWLQVGPLLHIPVRSMLPGPGRHPLACHRQILAGLKAGDAETTRAGIASDLEEAACLIAAELD